MNIKLKKNMIPSVNSPEEIYVIMSNILKRENRIDRNREHLWTMSLDAANKILNIELVSMGSVKSTVVEPMEVFSVPLQKRAVSIIIIHNHPSGTMKPSPADKDITDRLIQCGLMLKVPVLDHLIISEEAFYSFSDAGLMAELEKSTKYVPDFILKERMKKEVDEALKKGKAEGKLSGKEMGKMEKAKAMAKAMKEKGYKAEEIIELTGLTKKQLGRLNSYLH